MKSLIEQGKLLSLSFSVLACALGTSVTRWNACSWNISRCFSDHRQTSAKSLCRTYGARIHFAAYPPLPARWRSPSGWG